MKKENRIDNFLSHFDLFKGNSPTFLLIFGFMFIIVIEEHATSIGFWKYFIEISVSIFVIVRVLREAFFSKENKQENKK